MWKGFFEEGTLHESARRGVLNLIPKAGKDVRHIKNLRPITLLNTDYKIIEKAMAKRFDSVLNDIIHRDQTGFMANRRICANIRKVYDLMEFCKDKEIEAILLNLDFAKCFDKISFECIMGSLRYFNFPPYMQKWVEILYSDFGVRIQNNGRFTDRIPIEKSVHQGGCSSVQIFLICAELIAIELRECREIKGIPVEEFIFLLNQYADDMNVASLFDRLSINNILEKLEKFRLSSGFCISYDKTSILRIGSLRNSDAKIFTQANIAWTSEINVLGIQIGYTQDSIDCNYDRVIQKIQGRLTPWVARNLSLCGKINVLNTLIGSLFNYLFAVLPSMNEKQLARVQDAFGTFLWKGSRAKIPLRILQLDKKDGGLQLVDLRRRDCAIKASWIQILDKDPKLSTLVYSFFAKEIKEHIWRCNFSVEDVKEILDKKRNPFWFDTLSAWARFNFQCDLEYDQIIWFNSHIKINNHLVFWPKCFNKGLLYLSQLYEQRHLISAITANRKFSLEVMSYNSLVSALPKTFRNVYKVDPPLKGSPYDRILLRRDISKIIYKSISVQDNWLHDKCAQWNSDVESSSLDLKGFIQHIRAIYCISNIPKLRSFQYRLLMRALVLNMHLFRWGMRGDNLCEFCRGAKETYSHLFVDCPEIKHVWDRVWKYAERFTSEPINSNTCAILFNRPVRQKKSVVNVLCLITKQYIYSQRCQKEDVNFNSLKARFLMYEKIEKYVAVKNRTMDKHCVKWKCSIDDEEAIDAQDYIEGIPN